MPCFNYISGGSLPLPTQSSNPPGYFSVNLLISSMTLFSRNVLSQLQYQRPILKAGTYDSRKPGRSGKRVAACRLKRLIQVSKAENLIIKGVCLQGIKGIPVIVILHRHIWRHMTAVRGNVTLGEPIALWTPIS